MFCRSLDPDRCRTGDRNGPDRTGPEHLGLDRFQKTDPYHQIIIRSYHHIIISYHHSVVVSSYHLVIIASYHHSVTSLHHHIITLSRYCSRSITRSKNTKISKFHTPLFGEFSRSSGDLCHYSGYNAMNLGTIGWIRPKVASEFSNFKLQTAQKS